MRGPDKLQDSDAPLASGPFCAKFSRDATVASVLLLLQPAPSGKIFLGFFFLPQSQKVTVSASSVISSHSHSICSEEEAHPSLHPGRWLLVGRLEKSRCRHHRHHRRHHQVSMVRDQVAARVRAEKDCGRKQSVRLEKTHLSQQLDDSTFNL